MQEHIQGCVVSSPAYHVHQGFPEPVAGVRREPRVKHPSKQSAVSRPDGQEHPVPIAGLLQSSGLAVISPFQAPILLGGVPASTNGLVQKGSRRDFRRRGILTENKNKAMTKHQSKNIREAHGCTKTNKLRKSHTRTFSVIGTIFFISRTEASAALSQAASVWVASE